MKTLASWVPATDMTVTADASGELAWIVSVDRCDAEREPGHACCPVCGTQSSSLHSSYIRMLRDLSAQGKLMNIQAGRPAGDAGTTSAIAGFLPGGFRGLQPHSPAGQPDWPELSGCWATARVGDPRSGRIRNRDGHPLPSSTWQCRIHAPTPRTSDNRAPIHPANGR